MYLYFTVIPSALDADRLVQEPALAWLVLAASTVALVSILAVLVWRSWIVVRSGAWLRQAGSAASTAASTAAASASASAAVTGTAAAATHATVNAGVRALAVGGAKPAVPALRPLPGEMSRGFDPVDREFLPAALELLETPPSPVRVAGIWLICAAFTVSLVWSYFGKLDIHAVAQGRIQPSGRTKVIQPVEAGKVVAILVENGSRVKAGDVLLELDPTETGADRQSQTRDLESARAEAARRAVALEVARVGDGNLTALPIAFEPTLGREVRMREEMVLDSDLRQLKSIRASLIAQLAERRATRAKLVASIEARAKVIALSKERVNMRAVLNERGSLSRALVIEVLSQYESQVAQQVTDQGQLAEIDAAINTVSAKIDEVLSNFISEQAGKLAEAERKADRIGQDLVKATAKNERATLRAPIAGTVQQLAISTVGQVVTGAQALMTIVPTGGPIEIEAMIQNQDIGFVELGQEAVIKVEAFPFTRYGSIVGKIVRVSRDAVEERDALAMSDPMTAARPAGASMGAGNKGPNLVFPATVRLEKSTINVDGKDIPLSPGMSVTVEVLTGQRRAIDYVLAPLREVAAGSGRER